MARVTRLMLVSLVLTLPTVLRAADSPALTYKIILPFQAGDRAVFLLKLESKDGKWTGTATPGPKVPPAKVESVKIEKDVLSFTLNLGEVIFDFEGRVPKEKDAKILGTVSMKGDISPALLEPTTLPSLEPFDVSRELLTKSTDNVAVFRSAIVCLSGAAEKKVKPEEAKVWAEKAVKAAEPFGARWQRRAFLDIAEILAEQEGFTALAIEYAELAEKTIIPTDSPAHQKRVLTVLADALDKAGKKEDARKVRERNDKISSIAGKKFPGRKGKSDRVVVVELFTNAQQPGSVATDSAFNALLTTYKPSEVVLLQYHLNVPGPDPLTNQETEVRAKFYETSRTTPSLFFNGGKMMIGPGSITESQDRYDQINEALAEMLEKPTKLKLTVVATRKGSKIDIKADVADLQETGPDVRLRVALVEDEVEYTGANKLTKHMQVVRHFPNGAAGTAMKAKTSTESFTVDLDVVRKNLKAFLDKTNETQPFPTKDRPLDLKKLRVVAFVQNDETGEVLNAVQVDVKGE